MATDAQIAILITAQDRAQAALGQAQRAVAALGSTAVKTQAQHKRAFDLIGRDNTTLHKGLEVVQRRAETLFKTFESGSLGLNLVSLGLGGVGMAAVGVGMAFNSSMQQASLAFGVLLKGPGQAEAAIQALTDVAKNLPFTLTPIIQAGQRLTSAGFQDVPGLITTIADAISATGNISNDSLQSVVSSFVQLRSSGTFSMGVISDLTQAGIPVIRALAQQMGMTEFATSRMLESMSGKVPADFLIPKITDALKAMTGGLAAKEVNTLAGAITNLQDRFAIFMGGLTGGVTDVAQGAVSGLATMFNDLTDSMKTWDPTVKKTLGFALLLGSAVAGVGGLGGAVPGLGALGSLFGGGAGAAGPMLAIVITLIGLIALVTPWGAIFEGIRDFGKTASEKITDVAAAVGTGVATGVGQGVSLVGGPLGVQLVWLGDLATKIGSWLEGAPIERSLAVKAAWVASTAGGIATWLEGAPVERTLAVAAGWARGTAGSIASWLEAAPVERTLAVAAGWAAGQVGGIASWLENAPVERTLSLAFGWAKGVATAVADWLEGAPISRALSLGFGWAAGVATTIASWLSDQGAIGRTLALGFEWGAGVLASVQGWLQGGTIERTLALGFRWLAGVLGSVQGWLEGGEVERTLALGFRWLEGVLGSVQTWLQGGEIERTLALGFRWLEGVAGAVQDWLQGGVIERTLALGFRWVEGVAWQIQGWLMGGVIERTLSLGFTWVGGMLTEVGRWLQDPAAITRTLVLAVAWAKGPLDAILPWLEHPHETLTRTLILNLTAGSFADWLKGWVSGTVPGAPSGVTTVPRGGPPPGGIGSTGEGVAWYPDVPGGPSMPHRFAEGGIVTRPTLGMVGESGPEAIIPLSQAGGMGGLTINITVNGSMLGTDLEDLIVQQIDNARRRARLPATA